VQYAPRDAIRKYPYCSPNPCPNAYQTIHVIIHSKLNISFPAMPSPTASRKKDHVDLCVNEHVTFRQKTSGFERISFVHNALPEMDFEEVKTEMTFLEKRVAMPLMVSCMTGGYAEAERINRELAEVCAEANIPMGVGSQRQALETTQFHDSFSIVRKVAPNIPITANIGGAEVAKSEVRTNLHRLVEMIEADALTVHLNPLQELMQPEGSPRFKGVLAGIEDLCKTLGVPVIVKEVGAGLSSGVAIALMSAGVRIIDVAGAGGTSWAGVEIMRSKATAHQVQNQIEDRYKEIFWDWGLTTLECLQMLEEVRKFHKGFRKEVTVIASGGITSGLDVAKAISLGADVAAAARPFLQMLMDEGQTALAGMVRGWHYQLRATMFLTGVQSLGQLRQVRYNEAAHVE
jgi:isopentenyl-diphosphate delta-isomerase